MALRWLRAGVNAPLLLAALAGLLFLALDGSPAMLRVTTMAGISALLAIGYGLIFGHAGALSLCQATFFGIGAYVSGALSAFHGWSYLATVPPSLLAASLLAVLVAVPTLRLGAHAFALATLAVSQAAVLIAVQWAGVTGGADGIAGVPPPDLLGWAVPRGWPALILVWSLVAAGAAAAAWFTAGRRGQALALLRANPLALGPLGIDQRRLQGAAFLLSAALAALAGTLQPHLVRVVSPGVLDFPVMVACLTMTVVGGRLRPAGAILGALLLTWLPEWLRGFDQWYLFAYGAALLLAIVAAPDGILGALEAARRRLRPEPPPPLPAMTPLPPGAAQPAGLRVAGVTRSFGGMRALDGVTFAAPPGITGVIGPNGSGKTTLLNVISGIVRPDGGSVRLDGVDLAALPAHRVARTGVARTFQTPVLIDDATVLDNIRVAGVTAGQALFCLASMGLAAQAARRAGSLPQGTRRLVEIARALARRPRLLLLDEPAAGLTQAEQARLAVRLAALAQTGLSLLIVEHAMPFLMPLATHMVCLDQGRVIAEGTPDAVRSNPLVLDAYLGRPGRAA
ncbi:MAG: ATP-binding cassette domain-containing protein [Acetobacteraceae bacterium]